MPSDLAFVKSTRRFILSVLRLAGIPDEQRDELALVFTEMANNSIEHGCCPTDSEASIGISVELTVGVEDVEILVRDPGGGASNARDLSRALEDAEVAPPVGNERGMGLYLVRCIMDEVEVRDEGNQGTVMRALKRWSAAR
jgi:anti-sigma regulatory factor (Ser/Thr protein kinase)